MSRELLSCQAARRISCYLGLSIQGETWKQKDQQITRIKNRFGLSKAEIHAGWMARRYIEQERIKGFETLSELDRREAVRKARDAFLISKAAVKGVKSVQSDRKNFQKTDAYIHLTRAERADALRQIVEVRNTLDRCLMSSFRSFTRRPAEWWASDTIRARAAGAAPVKSVVTIEPSN